MGLRGAALASVWLIGCGVGTGTGSVQGSLFLGECTADKPLGEASAPVAFDLQPSYFVADLVNDPERLHPMNRLAIRVQSGGHRIEEADGLFVTVADVRLIALQPGQRLEVGPTTNLRATLGLRRTCPDAPVELELDGTLTFTRFGAAAQGSSVPDDFAIRFGDPLAATFSFDVVDRRARTLAGTGAVTAAVQVGGHLDGGFDFVVRQGRAAQAYP